MIRKFLPVALTLLLSLSILLSGCSEDPANLQTNAADPALKSLEDGELSDVETHDLLWVREEEKLARDVYIVMGEIYGLTVFANIQLSEQAHMDAMLGLLNTYGLEDPVGDNGVGEFSDHHLQDLHDGLITEGEQSKVDALLVGLAIEEIDMIDLVDAMERSDHEDIIHTFDNLCEGSKNHLRAFVGVYESQTGETYVPRYITQDFYDEIMGVEEDEAPVNDRKGRKPRA